MTTVKNSRARWSSIGWLTVACLAGSLSARDRPRHVGLPEDWSHGHLIFSNPGTYAQMLEPGVSQERWRNWLAVQQEPRFRMQQAKRNRGRGSQGRDSTPAMAPGPDRESMQAGNARFADKALKRVPRPPKRKPPTMQRDWNMDLGAAPPAAMYPAKFNFDVNGTPDCENDFVVFPIGDLTVVGEQAALIAFNNLYTPGLCGAATEPSFKFAYQIGSGVVRTSPVLSLDGTKIAFVDALTNISDFPNFHVLTIGTNGFNGNSTQGVPIGPSGGNNAVDTFVQMAGGNSVTRSSPFVLYDADRAFVGDDHGNLHQFFPVFRGPLTEVVDGLWPMSVGADVILTSPVFFNNRIFFGASNGRLYCAEVTGTFCFPTSSIPIGDTPILDAPIVDGSTFRVFVATQEGNRAILVQTTTDLDESRTITVDMGLRAPAGFDIHNGAFDHRYLTGADPSAGFMYFCGTATSGNAPTLYRVGFQSTGRVNDARDPFSLQLTNAATDNDVCSPLTEIYNANTPGGPTDLLFLTVARNPQAGCRGPNNNCMASLDITTLAFPTDFRSIFQLQGSGQGTSAIVVDNVAEVVPTWLAGTPKALDDLIVDSNGNVQQCTTAGTSRNQSPPTWNTTVDSTTDDNTAIWTMRGPYQGSWQPLHPYNLNDVITDGVLAIGGLLTPHLQRVTTAGTSGTTQPAFIGSPTADEGVTWTSLGAYTPSSVSSVYFSDVGAKKAYKLTQAGLQ